MSSYDQELNNSAVKLILPESDSIYESINSASKFISSPKESGSFGKPLVDLRKQVDMDSSHVWIDYQKYIYMILSNRLEFFRYCHNCYTLFETSHKFVHESHKCIHRHEFETTDKVAKL